MKNVKIFCIAIATIIFTAGMSHATKFVYDFNYQEPIEYFWIDDNWFDPSPTPIDDGDSGNFAFTDRVMTFVGGAQNNPSNSVDGHTLTYGSGTQHGTIALYWDAPITSATIDLAVMGNITYDADMLSMEVYNQSEMIEHSFIFEENTDISYLSLDIDFQSGFDCIWFKTFGLYDIDTITFGSPVPEPGSIFLLATGLMSIAGLRKRSSSFS